MKRILRYFFNGLLFVVPASISIYALVSVVNWLDKVLLLNLPFPGLGVAIVLAGTTVIGYLGSIWLTKPILVFLEKVIEKVPLVNLIYSSIKDLTSAFVGEKKKFNRPVLVSIEKNSNLRRLGFITEENLTELGIKEGSMAVYIPHSYNFSGNLYIVDKEAVTLLDANGTEIMKFIVSGGVSGLEE
jgi:uncharacterized membrane protein